MRVVVVFAVLFAAFPSAGLAAPPPNDNRADAAAIPSFPSTLSATTAEATVERLDPQVSRCGRVESTVWYRIDTAPDGLVSLTIAGSAGTAPVLRIYRRARSSIQEIDCAAPAPGQSASATFEAVRGNNYLVLVGRRPGSPDGTFDLKAELFLPPANDNRGGALALRLPGAVAGSTLGATSDESDPGCGIDSGTVWYRMTGGRGGRVLLRLAARGELDAAVAVLERVRSQLRARRLRPDESPGRRVGHVRGAPRRHLPHRRRPQGRLGSGDVPARVAALGGGREQACRKAAPACGSRYDPARADGRQRRLAHLDAAGDDLSARVLVGALCERFTACAAEPRQAAGGPRLSRLHDLHSGP